MWREGDIWSEGSSAPVVGRLLLPGNRILLEMDSMVVRWWIGGLFCVVNIVYWFIQYFIRIAINIYQILCILSNCKTVFLNTIEPVSYSVESTCTQWGIAPVLHFNFKATYIRWIFPSPNNWGLHAYEQIPCKVNVIIRNNAYEG